MFSLVSRISLVQCRSTQCILTIQMKKTTGERMLNSVTSWTKILTVASNQTHLKIKMMTKLVRLRPQ